MTEEELWRQWRPKLRGWWERIEVYQPLGYPDVYGIYELVGQYIELKVGPPSSTLLRTSQKLWLRRWWDLGGEAHIMVGDVNRIQFFRDVGLRHPVTVPFYA